jgi:hypothetical protein
MMVSHGACGKRWNQSGNATSHCGGCHNTFASLAIFDSHRRDGQCVPPQDVHHHGYSLRIGGDEIWFCPGSAAHARAAFPGRIAGPNGLPVGNHPTSHSQADLASYAWIQP